MPETHSSLTIVVPAYNEEASLAVFLPELLQFCEQRGHRLVVVNDGSADGTKAVLEKHRGHPQFGIVHHKVNRGYGGAIKSGIEAAETEFVITVDADGQHRLEDITKLHDYLKTHDADMVVGRRTGAGGSSYRSLGKWLIRSVAKMLLPIKIHDINSGIKIYNRKLALRYLTLCPDGMPYSDIITMIFVNQRHLVLETEVQIRARKAGRSTISTRTAFQTVYEILNITMLFNPLKVFLPLSMICVLAGLGWGMQFMVVGKGVSIGALLAILTGVIFFLLGLLAEQLSYIRKNQIRE